MRQLRDMLVWLLLFSVPILICYSFSVYGKLAADKAQAGVTPLVTRHQ